MPGRQYPSRLGSGALAVTAWLLTSASGRKSRRVEPCDRCPSRPRIWTDWPGRTRSMSRGKIGKVATVRDGSAITNMGRSEEHTSELQSLMRISYAVFCLKKKKKNQNK